MCTAKPRVDGRLPVLSPYSSDPLCSSFFIHWETIEAIRPQFLVKRLLQPGAQQHLLISTTLGTTQVQLTLKMANTYRARDSWRHTHNLYMALALWLVRWGRISQLYSKIPPQEECIQQLRSPALRRKKQGGMIEKRQKRGAELEKAVAAYAHLFTRTRLLNFFLTLTL